MSTMRVARRTRFATIDRRTINDERLSFRARGILTWILDKPDDWRFDATSVAAATSEKEGRKAILTAFRELKTVGYMRQTRLQDERGRWRTETLVYETPEPHMSELSEVAEVPLPNVGPPNVGALDAIQKTETETETELPRELKLAPLTDLAEHKTRRRSTDPRADGLVRAWWEDQTPRPIQPWPAAVGIVSKALGAGWDVEEIARALRDRDCGPPLSTGKLEQVLRRYRSESYVREARAKLDPGLLG